MLRWPAREHLIPSRRALCPRAYVAFSAVVSLFHAHARARARARARALRVSTLALLSTPCPLRLTFYSILCPLLRLSSVVCRLSSVVYRQLGVVHFATGEYSQARERFEKVLGIVEGFSSQVLRTHVRTHACLARMATSSGGRSAGGNGLHSMRQKQGKSVSIVRRL